MIASSMLKTRRWSDGSIHRTPSQLIRRIHSRDVVFSQRVYSEILAIDSMWCGDICAGSRRVCCSLMGCSGKGDIIPMNLTPRPREMTNASSAVKPMAGLKSGCHSI